MATDSVHTNHTFDASDLTHTFDASDLTVVIPTRDRWAILARTLEGLRHQSVNGFEIVVVVDGIDQQAAVPDFESSRVIEIEHGGPGAARNAGAKAATTPLVLFLGDDMVPDRNLVAQHLAAHQTHREAHSAVLGHVTWHHEVAHDPIARWLDRTGSQFDYATIDGPEAGFGRFYSCNVSLKRQFFLEVGGFDPSFTYYYEDLDCGYRLDEKGMKLWYEPKATARHLHHYDLASLERRFRGVAEGEHHMAAVHPWFEPFFLQRVRSATAAEPVSRWWPRLAEIIPAQAGFAHRLAVRRSDRWYQQRVAPAFLAGWTADEELSELRHYLGSSYDHQRLVRHQQVVDDERDAAPDEETFYRTSQNYLYDLTAFAMSGTKAPYLAELRAVLPADARVLDYGCGIGSDGLRLVEGGYDVSFADFANPSTDYLRWRLARRGVSAPIYNLDTDTVPGGFDAAYSLDVIEHVEDPFDFLNTLEQRAGIVMVNFLEEEEDDTDLHRPLPIAKLLDHAADCGMVRYRRYHDRSHLVLYRSPLAKQAAAAPSRVPSSGTSTCRLGMPQADPLRSIAQRHFGQFLPGRQGWFPVPRS